MPNNPNISPWSTRDRVPPRAADHPKDPLRAWRGLFAVILVALTVIVVGFFYSRKPQGPNVGLQFKQSGPVLLGDDQFVFSVSSSNYSDSILKDVKLSLELPDGVSFLGQSEGQRVMEQDIGDMGPGSIEQKSFKLIVTSGPNALKHLVAKLSYDTGVGSSVYETSAATDIMIGEPAVSLNITAPQSVLNGQNFDLQLHYANNTPHAFKNLQLKVSYPPFFQFKSSSMQSEVGSSNSWDLGTLPAGSNGTISITGSVVGQEGSNFSINGTLSADFLGETYEINTAQSANTTIAQAPLSLAVEVNNGSDYVANLGDALNYVLNYTNNSPVVMQNVAVSVKLTGDMYDFTSLNPDVPFNSLQKKITWFAGNTPQLLNIAPGQNGSIQFTIKLKNAFPIRLLSDKNYTVRADGQIQSPTVPPNTSADKTISVASITNKIGGKIDLVSAAYWRDAASGILNSGPYPPKVNQPTQYTIHWKITNYATDVTNITVSGFLQAGVRFTGIVKSNMSTQPSYDQNSGLITWQIPALPATKGVIGSPAEAIFQVEATPSTNQINQSMPLLGEAKLTATDSFVNTTLQDISQALDTNLPYDTTISAGSRNVQQ